MSSKEKDLKRLRKSLTETQDILNDLVKDTTTDLEKKWGSTRVDASKRLQEAGKKFEKRFEETKLNLESALKNASKDLEKSYPQQKKEVEKAINRFSDSAKYNYKDLNAEARKKFADLKTNANIQTQDLKLRAADLLQGLAVGVLSLRNRLEPKKRLALRNEKEKHHLGRGGYFKRFIALAIVIVSKKDRLLGLGQELYSKLQDSESRQSLKEDAIGQFDTMRRLIKAYANGHYKEFPYASILKIVAAVVYFVSVVDLIPDFIPVLGLTDDLAVLAWVYSSVKDDLQQFVDWEEANERRREKMESQKASSTASRTTPATDREAASANTTTTPTVKTTTTPATTPAGTTSGAGTGTNSAGANKTSTSGSNTGSAGGNASSTSGSSGSGTSASSGSSSTGSSSGNRGGSSGSSSGSSNSGSNR